MRVEVEDTSVVPFDGEERREREGLDDDDDDDDDGRWEVEERVQVGGQGVWEMPGSRGTITPGAPFGNMSQPGLASLSATPAGKIRIAPTARPPM